MKKINFTVLIVSSIFLIACGDKTKGTVEDTKKSVIEATTKAVDATKAAAAKTGDATAEAAKLAQEKAQNLADETKATAEKVVAETKKKAEKAKKAAKKIAEEAKQKVTETVKSISKKSVNTVEKTDARISDEVSRGDAEEMKITSSVADSSDGMALYTKCAGCHGKDGKTKALGKSAVIAGQSSATLIESIRGYKSGTRNISGMGTLMKGQVSSMSDSDIEAVAAYISTLK